MPSPLTSRLLGCALLVWAPLALADEVNFSVVHVYTNEPGVWGLGYYLATGGDVDADGMEDFLLHREADWRTGAPSVVAVCSGRSYDYLYIWQAPDFEFGTGSILGDVDRDGYADCLLSIPMYPGHPAVSSTVWVFSGTNGTVLTTLRGQGPGEGFGRSLALLNDVDGDGWSEVVVGAPNVSTIPYNNGRVYLISSRTAAILWMEDGASAGDGLPSDLGNLGDIDRDGIDDFIVSCDRTRVGGKRKGKVWVRSGRTQQVIYDLTGAEENGSFGYKLEVLDDTDADGFKDFAVGENTKDHVYSGATGSERFVWYDNGPDPGYLLSSIPDVDGDGTGDMLMGSEHNDWVLAVSGFDGKVLGRAIVTESRFPYAALGLKDVTGDGLPDFLATINPADEYGGRVCVFGTHSLRRTSAEGTSGGAGLSQLHVRAPALAGKLILLFFSLSAEEGTPLRDRKLPLDSDPLLAWSVLHPLLVALDATGRASFKLPDALLPGSLSGKIYGAYLSLDPLSPDGLGAISNAEVVVGDFQQ
ncbi:MAG: integrin alpha [Planctomycetota bacterium]